MSAGIPLTDDAELGRLHRLDSQAVANDRLEGTQEDPGLRQLFELLRQERPPGDMYYDVVGRYLDMTLGTSTPPRRR